MLRAFTVGFRKFIRVTFYYVALPRLIDAFAQLLAWIFLLWLSITWWQRYLTQKIPSANYRWPEPLALHLLFCSVRRSFYVEKKQKHPIHTHIHTHTHTHTNTHKTTTATPYPPRWNSPWRGERIYLTKRFQPFHQQEELIRVMPLRLSRTKWSSYISCQGLD